MAMLRCCDAGGAAPLLIARPSSKSAGKASGMGTVIIQCWIYKKVSVGGGVGHGDGC